VSSGPVTLDAVIQALQAHRFEIGGDVPVEVGVATSGSSMVLLNIAKVVRGKRHGEFKVEIVTTVISANIRPSE
jgi:hypothetical protein